MTSSFSTSRGVQVHPLTLPVGAHGDKGVCQCQFRIKKVFFPIWFSSFKPHNLAGFTPTSSHCCTAGCGSSAQRPVWEAWREYDYSLKRIKIIIRPVDYN